MECDNGCNVSDKISENKNKRQPKQLDSGRRLKKRCPPRLPQRNNDVYVHTKAPTKLFVKRCERLLETEDEVFVHGLGAAVGSAINLALQLRQQLGETLQFAVNTSSVELTDDILPESDNGEVESQKRFNSAVSIRLWYSDTKTTE